MKVIGPPFDRDTYEATGRSVSVSTVLTAVVMKT
jgi:hypothetical protein